MLLSSPVLTWGAALGLLVLTACSEASPSPSCPGVGAPTLLELSDLTPALGATVTNDAIVHSFTIVGDVSSDGLAVFSADGHTAGAPDPALTFQHVPPAAVSNFTSVAVTWETAPGHVELTAPVVFETPEGCAYQLPSSLFSYDVTAP